MELKYEKNLTVAEAGDAVAVVVIEGTKNRGCPAVTVLVSDDRVADRQTAIDAIREHVGIEVKYVENDYGVFPTGFGDQRATIYVGHVA